MQHALGATATLSLFARQPVVNQCCRRVQSHTKHHGHVQLYDMTWQRIASCCIANRKSPPAAVGPVASSPASSLLLMLPPSTALVACSSTCRPADVLSRPGPGPGAPLRLQPNARASQTHGVFWCCIPSHSRSAFFFPKPFLSGLANILLHCLCKLGYLTGKLHQADSLNDTALFACPGAHWPV